MKIRKCDDPRFPRIGGGVVSTIFLVVVTDLCSGIIGEVLMPKIRRYFGEDRDDCCGPPIPDGRGPRS